MEIASDFAFKPLPAIDDAQQVRLPPPKAVKVDSVDLNLGPLGLLPGKWEGPGFNTIWRPNNNPSSDNFLELNNTLETLTFSNSIGEIPNRGLLQPDITMFGVHYFQQVSDANDKSKAGLHIEPGLWVTVPQTSDPPVQPTVCRMGSIPHGTTVLAQGIAFEVNGPPEIRNVDITPFPIGQPQNTITPFHKNMDLNQPNEFRTADLRNITQEMVNDPNSVLTRAIAGQEIIHTTTLIVSSEPTNPVPGGGVTNTAFLEGDAQRGPNADAATVTAIFWIETVKEQDGSTFLQLQYTQTVMLNFATLSWPHVSVATLRKVA